MAFLAGMTVDGNFICPYVHSRCPANGKKSGIVTKTSEYQRRTAETETGRSLERCAFHSAFVGAGLNWRFVWYVLPDWIVWIAASIFLFAYILYVEVLYENTYLSRTVEIQTDQKVIDTGLYGIVRHPMYMATTLLFLAMPLVLASPFSFAIMLLYLPLIVRRIRNEETILEKGLPGYREYKQRVKYRLIPFLW